MDKKRTAAKTALDWRSLAALFSGLCLIALLLRCEGWLWWVCLLAAAVPLALVLRKPGNAFPDDASLGETLLAGALSLCYLYFFVYETDCRLGGVSRPGGWPALLMGLLGAYALWLFVLHMLRAARRALAAPMALVLGSPFRWLLIAAALGLVFVYTQTTLFYRPEQEGNLMLADRLFTSDTGAIVEYDAWRQVAAEENDFRQPLFAVFAMPFAIPLGCLGRLFPFFPDFYVFAMGVMQAFVLFLTYAMLAELTAETPQARRCFMLLLLITYPTLIFALNLEQYVFGVFWMIAFLYAAMKRMGGRKLLYAAATGSLLTTGVWFPLIAGPGPWKERLKETGLAALLMAWLLAAWGRFELLSVLERQVGRYGGYISPPLLLGDKLLQYVNFIGSCLLAPRTVISDPNGTFLLAKVTQLNPAGLMLLVLAVLGCVCFWQKPWIRLCACWMGFSFVLLCLIGWGTAENGLILYALYFGWAFLVPAWQMTNRALDALGRWKKWALLALGAAILLYNGVSWFELLRFARRCYPR